MKISKVFIISVLTIAMPISQARAVIPDATSIISDVVESSGTELHFSGVDSQHIILIQGVGGLNLPQAQDLVKPRAIAPSVVIDQTPGVEELEAQDQTEDQLTGLALPGYHFWTTKKLVITTSVLLTASLLVGLLLLLASGGSSGSGSSSGESGGGSGGTSGGSPLDSPLNLSSLPDGPTNPGAGSDNTTDSSLNNPPPGDGSPNGGDNDGDSTDADPDNPGDINSILGGGEGAGDNSSNGGLDQIINNSGLPGSGIPHHPEPSTFLLLGLGLLVPFLRRRSL